jgi:hypothetical protein
MHPSFFGQAVLRLGCSLENLGVILSASYFATKLFGYPVSMLERRNVNMLMPSPLSEVRDDRVG